MSGKDFIKKEVPSGEEICGIRMLDLIDTIKDTKVNEDQLQKFLPQAMEKLADMDREALIKQFLSVEFNQFLDYYSNSNDLNAQGGNDRKGSRNNDRGGRNNRGGRSGGRDRGITEAGYERFFINVGRRDGLNPVRLMGLVNEQLNGSKPDFGKIDLQNNFSFFEVETGYESALTNGVTGAKFEGRDVAVERAQDDKKSNSGGGRGGGGRRKNNDGGFPKGKRKSGNRKRSRK
jgi:ATP-dependent RNA helicase DeaD